VMQKSSVMYSEGEKETNRICLRRAVERSTRGYHKLYCTVLYCTVLQCTVLQCTVQLHVVSDSCLLICSGLIYSGMEGCGVVLISSTVFLCALVYRNNSYLFLVLSYSFFFTFFFSVFLFICFFSAPLQMCLILIFI
jgi:hypothetical protein